MNRNGLLGLVTAVVVNSALEQAMADKEMAQKQEDDKKRKTVKQLRKLFIRLDEDASGQVTMEEIGGIAEEDKQMLSTMLGVSDPLELFRALDTDGSGEVDIEEFCNGIWQVCISKTPIEIKRVEKMVEAMRHQLRVSESVMAEMVKDLGKLKVQVDEKVGHLSSSQLVAVSEDPKAGGLGCADGRRTEEKLAEKPSISKSASRGSNGSFPWDQASSMSQVRADRDGQLASGIQSCVREAVGAALRDLWPGGAFPAAAHGGFGAQVRT
ncbi:unnamed protein product [Prorocentrum cordatum]|uniref:EF-hand domain-containing protein n=1 Tax=Prorocentrum cordatum TaxID=2364126 RepID=A0ABN9Q3R3_9DINO|nr:unnamed protein product [Polarella glacialis]